MTSEWMTMPAPDGNGTAFCSGMGRVMGPGFWWSPGGFCVLFMFPGAVLDSAVKYSFGLIGAILLGIAFEVSECVHSFA
jgi:hypothetical protein